MKKLLVTGLALGALGALGATAATAAPTVSLPCFTPCAPGQMCIQMCDPTCPFPNPFPWPRPENWNVVCIEAPCNPPPGCPPRILFPL